MRSSHGRPVRAFRRISGLAALCCALGAGIPVLAPPGVAAAEGRAAPGPAAFPGGAPQAAVEPGGTARGAVREQADLSLRSELGLRGDDQKADAAGATDAATDAATTGTTDAADAQPETQRQTTAGTSTAVEAAAGEAGTADDGVYEYRITVVNHGPSQAVNVTVTDELPAALTFVSSPDGCTAQARQITCGPLATLDVGRSHTWLLTVRLADDYSGDGSDIVNVAAVTSQTADPDPANNTASLTGLPVPPVPPVPPVTGKADLSLRKTAVLPGGKRWVSPGDTFTYRVTVHNNGPAAARSVQVTDPLPDVLRFVSSSDGCAPAEPAGQTVVCPVLNRLPAGDSAVYEIVVQVRENSVPRSSGPSALSSGYGHDGDGDGDGDGHGHGHGHDGDDGHGHDGDDGHGHDGDDGHGHGKASEIDNIASVTSATPDPVPGNNENASGTTGPGGGPLLLKEPSRPTRPGPTYPGPTHSGPVHPTRPGPTHQGRPGPHLADTGGDLPGWLPWSAVLALASGASMVALSRRASR
ncbi:DUF11 domain-containing protein [Streptomyces jumonjinensis]|uniref:DUF11 domain-containing protein n=1 Tax=Streptomyces jumonjinensis TaxID=1945 RepID=A0A646KM66_STRJU|nr:DUF11 domain-containing protein [Streptomyces jumonjinensis]MQT03402.1 DUF11 domain-containing protein [Streptomyces jumonjinensis]